MSQLVRLNKLLAERFLCSRREADQLIRSGCVAVFEGRESCSSTVEIPAVLGARVPRTCHVRLREAPPATGQPGRIATKPTTMTTSQRGRRQDRDEKSCTSRHNPIASAVNPVFNGCKNMEKTTVLFHKPLGIVSCQPGSISTGSRKYVPAIRMCTSDREHKVCHDENSNNDDAEERKGGTGSQRPSVPAPQAQLGWRVAGRLDVNSTGLLVLTRSGRVASQVLGNSVPDDGGAECRRIEKEYLVRVPQLTTDSPAVVREKLRKLSRGIRCGTDELTALKVTQINPHQLQFVLDRGRRHHIRRMCRQVGWDAAALKRVRVGRIRLGDLPVGRWRYLQPHESFA
jgi:23S rRNA pseudouridine2604 synthase